MDALAVARIGGYLTIAGRVPAYPLICLHYLSDFMAIKAIPDGRESIRGQSDSPGKSLKSNLFRGHSWHIAVPHEDAVTAGRMSEALPTVFLDGFRVSYPFPRT